MWASKISAVPKLFDYRVDRGSSVRSCKRREVSNFDYLILKASTVLSMGFRNFDVISSLSVAGGGDSS